MEEARTTWHGKNRTKQRVGIPKRAIDKNTKKAFAEGIKHGETTGSLRNYLDGQFLKEGTANNLRIYNGNIYIFCDKSLVTVLKLPSRFRKIELEIKKKRGRNE